MNVNALLYPTLAAGMLFFFVGGAAVHSVPIRMRALLIGVFVAAALPAVLFVSFYLHLFDTARWFYEFRTLPFTELSAAGAGLMAGAVADTIGRRRWFARLSLLAALVLVIAAPHLKPVLMPIPDDVFKDSCEDGICLQSTPSSCGAASAATILRFLGVTAGERELARECFTYQGGTEIWYIARAFRQRGLHIRYRFESGFPADLHTPAIAGVRIGRAGHFIAVLEHSGGRWVLGDPLIGKRIVAEESVGASFDFTGFFLEVGKRD